MLCITKFQDDLINNDFLLRVYYKSAKEILQKDDKNIFLNKSLFIKGKNNSLPKFSNPHFFAGKT